jgi:hypothetical protein
VCLHGVVCLHVRAMEGIGRELCAGQKRLEVRGRCWRVVWRVTRRPMVCGQVKIIGRCIVEDAGDDLTSMVI